jgi:DNA helicase-2/ATP-dependent DNA helicase PcrA
MTPSPQQADFYHWVATGSGSCVLEAVAGAGKSTTLVNALSLMRGDVFFGAYNKAIADELKARVQPNPAAKIDVGTFHAAGFRFWRRVARDVQIDSNKCRKIFRAASEKYADYAPYESCVLQLVSLAKQAGIGILRPNTEAEWAALVDRFDVECPLRADGSDGTELAVKLASRTLRESVAQDMQVIDFDDMIYAPLVHNARVWAHDWVLIDEAQDTNATRRALALRMLKRGGRLVAVGDPRQAIYGFTGADSDALDLIAAAVSAVRMPLTVTYRCPKAVVAYAQQWVQHITAADTAPEGEVVVPKPEAKLATLATPGDAVLCRFSAPLIKNVYAFIAAGIPARVEGREIGDGLKALATRWKTDSLTQLSTYLGAYLESECAKLRAKEKESKAVALEDKVECLRVIMARVKDADKKAGVAELLAAITSLFGNEGEARACVTFSTIHKSKGREWNRVVWLQTGPSPWARKQWELVQEENLCYVAATRAKNTLVLVPTTR